MSSTERKRAGGGLGYGEIETSLVPGPVEYATLSPDGAGPEDRPILIWLHGGGGSRRFLHSCQPQFASCWADRSLPAITVATPSAGWSFYLDHHDGVELWETFLLDEFIPRIRQEAGSVYGPVFVGGISVGGLGALRMAFRYPDSFAGVVAIEPTIEAALSWDRVVSRDQVIMPPRLRQRLFGAPLDHQFWRANHPTALAVANSTALAASELAIYIEAGDEDRMHVQYGTELLHRCLFDMGLRHEYRLTRGGNHVGPSVEPRIAEGLRFIGRRLWKSYDPTSSVDAMIEIDGFDHRIRQLEDSVGYRRTRVVAGPAGEVEVRVQGDGPPVVLLASLGRSAKDFIDLSDRLAAAGYRVLAVEPRGLSGSSQSLVDVTLLDLADDVAAVITDNRGGPATIVGHDFGGHVARATARNHPGLVRNMVLLATPGPELPRPEPATAHRRVFIPELTMEEHLESVAVAFFADGNDPVAWVDGWHPVLAAAQLEALQRTPMAAWSNGGAVETLIVRPAQDRLVSQSSTRLLANELRGKVSVVEVPCSGHALLPEQPEAVAVSVLTWLRRQG